MSFSLFGMETCNSRSNLYSYGFRRFVLFFLNCQSGQIEVQTDYKFRFAHKKGKIACRLLLLSVNKHLQEHFHIPILFAVFLMYFVPTHFAQTWLFFLNVFHKVTKLVSQLHFLVYKHKVFNLNLPLSIQYHLHNHIQYVQLLEKHTPTISYLLWAVLFCAAMHPGKDTAMPDGAVVSPMLRATICTPLSGSHLPRAKIALPWRRNMHLYPTHWWHNLYNAGKLLFLALWPFWVV